MGIEEYTRNFNRNFTTILPRTAWISNSECIKFSYKVPTEFLDAHFVHRYHTATVTSGLPPHVYGIGADSFQGLLLNKKPQAVLISGESGAGKTESTKHVLSYLADIAGNTDMPVENKILSTNPVRWDSYLLIHNKTQKNTKFSSCLFFVPNNNSHFMY